MVVKNPVDLIALILVIVGGLNWGLVGLFNFDLVAAIFGAGSTLSRIVYIPWVLRQFIRFISLRRADLKVRMKQK